MRVLSVQTSLVTAMILAMLAGPAIAGGYAPGYGETPEVDQKAALNAAESAVRTRGTGCVGHDDPNAAMRLVGKRDGLWVFEAHYRNHNGGCHRLSWDQEFLRQLGADLAKQFVSRKG